VNTVPSCVVLVMLSELDVIDAGKYSRKRVVAFVEYLMSRRFVSPKSWRTVRLGIVVAVTSGVIVSIAPVWGIGCVGSVAPA
jgi:hypothetical protein